MEEALAWTVGLYPFAVDDELGDRSLAYMADDFVRSAGSGLDVNLGVGDLVFIEKALGLADIAAPGSGIDQYMHPKSL
jgi:hypothetical protein